MRGLVIMFALLAGGSPATPDASQVEVPDAGARASSGSCEELRARFYTLADASRSCGRDADCDCVDRIDVSGGGLLGAEKGAAAKLRSLAKSYSKKRCPISCRSSNAPVCHAHCADGVCAP
jgi:hypothetical protein